MSKALVSLSGGIDSTTTLYMAINNHGAQNVQAISFDYGQRHKKELDVAARIAALAGVDHTIIPINFAMLGITSALTDDSRVIPSVSYDQIEGQSPAYVPFRNGIMLSIAIGFAASRELDYVYAGPHAEDAENWAYADCTLEFMGAMSAACYVGTYNKVRVMTPLLFMSKASVVTAGYGLDAPLSQTWSCYIGGDKHCGVCPTCRARKEAFRIANVLDETEYAA